MEHHEMRTHRFPLDDATADRLAAGALDPSDAPPGYAGAARLLADAKGGFAAPPVDERLIGEMVRAISPRPRTDRTPTMISKLRSAKVATLAAAVVFSTAGAAAAANGSLPEPAQDALVKAAERVGFELPASNDDKPVDTDDDATERDNHGAEVSGTAHDTEATGREKGAAISEVARAGHGPDAPEDDATEDDATDEATVGDAQRGKPADPGSQAPVATPNPGGTGTASEASGGRSDVGTANAHDAAAKGSANAPDHPTADDNPGSSRRR